MPLAFYCAAERRGQQSDCPADHSGKRHGEADRPGDFAVLDEQAIPDQPKSEPEELLQSMQTMAQTLKKNREDIERYIQALGEMNKQLESMVDARTLELSQTVKALRESNRVKSTFLANVSHELRTPLSSNISHRNCCWMRFSVP